MNVLSTCMYTLVLIGRDRKPWTESHMTTLGQNGDFTKRKIRRCCESDSFFTQRW